MDSAERRTTVSHAVWMSGTRRQTWSRTPRCLRSGAAVTSMYSRYSVPSGTRMLIQLVTSAVRPPRQISENPSSAYLDLPLFMKYVGVQNLLAEWDGVLGYAGLNNFYLYRFEKKTLSQFLLWDADNTFHAIDFPILAEHDQNVLMRRAMSIPALRSAYFTTLLSAATSAEEFSEDEATADADMGIAPRGWLEREIDRLYALIGPTVRTDTLRPFSNDDFEEAVALLKRFSHERGPFVRCEVTKITAPSNAAAVCGPEGS